MTLILGAYSNQGRIPVEAVAGMLEEFSLNQSRELHTVTSAHLMLATTRAAVEQAGVMAESSDGKTRLLFGGKIRNLDHLVRKLRGSGKHYPTELTPGEILIQAYRELGTAFVAELRGVFGLVVDDAEQNTLILANDNWGRYPFFIHQTDRWLTFSSEFQPLTKTPGFDHGMNCDAIAEYFALGQVLGDKTFYTGINNLPPGTTLVVNRAGTRLHHRKNFAIGMNHNLSLESFAEQAATIVRSSVQDRYLDPQIKTWILTGGVDTRLQMGLLHPHQRQSVQFLTTHSAVLSEDEDTDCAIAKMLARKFDLNLGIRTARQGPLFDSSHFQRNRPNGHLARTAQGHFGGEHLGGVCMIEKPCLAIKDERVVGEMASKLLSPTFLRGVRNPFESLQEELREQRAENLMLLLSIHQAGRSFLSQIYRGSRGGWDTPRKFPLTLDSIFWDEELLDFLLTVPESLLEPYVLYSEIYNKHFPEFTEVPTNNALITRVPGSRMTLIAQGTNPKAVRANLYEGVLQRYLSSDATWEKNIYNRSFLNHLEEGQDIDAERRLVDFEAWYQANITNQPG